jgi:hypothetical protein
MIQLQEAWKPQTLSLRCADVCTLAHAAARQCVARVKPFKALTFVSAQTANAWQANVTVMPAHSDAATRTHMNLHLSIGPLVSLVAGILILAMPRLLNYIVAVYLILIGLIGLFGTGGLQLH